MAYFKACHPEPINKLCNNRVLKKITPPHRNQINILPADIINVIITTLDISISVTHRINSIQAICQQINENSSNHSRRDYISCGYVSNNWCGCGVRTTERVHVKGKYCYKYGNFVYICHVCVSPEDEYNVIAIFVNAKEDNNHG